MSKYTSEELNDAIVTCLDYILSNASDKRVVSDEENLVDIVRNLQNKDGSPFLHYYPYFLVFKATSGCNLRCKHCFYSEDAYAYDTANDLPEEELFALLRYFVEEVNIISCSLTGGEVFSVPYGMKFLEYLKSKNVYVEILTNGTLLTEKDIKKLKTILNPKTDCVQVSLEGPGEINDFIRGKGVYDKALKTIKLLADNGITVCVSMTVNNLNVSRLEEMYDICRDLKVTQFSIGKIAVYAGEHNKLVADNEDIIVNIAKVINKFKKYNDTKIKIRALKVFDFFDYEAGMDYLEKNFTPKNNIGDDYNLHCRPRDGQVALFPNGDISLCYNCDRKDMSIGNIKEQSFDEIWKNRHDFPLFQKRLLKSTCKNCKYLELCRGCCPAMAYKKYGTIDAPAGICKYAEKMLEKNIWKIEKAHV